MRPRHALYVLLATTGMRRGEALGLTWDALDLEGARLSVRRTIVDVEDGRPVWSDPRTRRGVRVIALDEGTVRSLRAHRAAQAQERLSVGAGYRQHDLAFTLPDGGPLHPDRLSRTFISRVSKAGVPAIRLHDLRHTWATLALGDGVHPKIVSDRLGHSTIAITLDTYSHVTPAMQTDAAERVAAGLGL